MAPVCEVDFETEVGRGVEVVDDERIVELGGDVGVDVDAVTTGRAGDVAEDEGEEDDDCDELVSDEKELERYKIWAKTYCSESISFNWYRISLRSHRCRRTPNTCRCDALISICRDCDGTDRGIAFSTERWPIHLRW